MYILYTILGIIIIIIGREILKSFLWNKLPYKKFIDILYLVIYSIKSKWLLAFGVIKDFLKVG